MVTIMARDYRDSYYPEVMVKYHKLSNQSYWGIVNKVIATRRMNILPRAVAYVDGG